MSPLHRASRLEAAIAPAQGTVDHLWSMLLTDSTQPQIILFTATQPGEGSSSMATCAAIGLARHLLEPVILVEADFQREGLSAELGFPPGPGFGELIGGVAEVDDALQSTGVPGLSLVAAGRLRGEPQLGTAAVSSTLLALSRRCRYLIVDIPPLLEHADGRVFLPPSNGVVLVTSAGRSRRSDIRKTVQIVEACHRPIIGAVLNQYRKVGPEWLTPA